LLLAAAVLVLLVTLPALTEQRRLVEALMLTPAQTQAAVEVVSAVREVLVLTAVLVL
jgi:hypothetical protein